MAGAACMSTGCSNEKDFPIDNLTVVETGNVKPSQKAESTQPTAILGSGGSMSSQFSQTFTNIVELEKAKHVIIDSEDLDSYKEEVLAAYKRGAVITIVNPEAKMNLDEWCEQQGMVFPADPSSIDDCSLISFNRKAASMTVGKNRRSTEIIIEEDDVPLVIFTGWLDKLLTPNLKGPDFRSKDIKKRFTPQHVSHVFTIDLPKEVLEKTNWAIPENASLSTTAEFSCDVYPLHSFAENASFSGDLYAVEATLTLHNGNLYNGRWQYTKNNGAWLYEVCGFYLSECALGAKLLEKGNKGLAYSTGHLLAGGPAPASASGTNSYQSGFEWNFDGWLTGGNGLESATPTPIQQGGWTWNNLADNAAEDLKIETSTDEGNPSWVLGIENLPFNESTPVPDLATGDLTFHFSWIWAVPQAVDNSTERYYMNINLFTSYMWNWTLVHEKKFEKDNVMQRGDCSNTFLLIPPSRSEGQRI